eukprot:Plantae.Rhodophyta-Hildenbrandia_rubra.ctg15680.p1 GENE.Plantae.Rhodophyta-Hildenbrandia_rubra.ctg15680~~Plantae.Rhodophyta-Hildenbrandia_rubra.ctg15680.p1  ORF type:complete len:670 (-),score=109.23 Plantae.Rhodophyta-Hildenbrandia_rubra.ctg15680:2223-4232(-)
MLKALHAFHRLSLTATTTSHHVLATNIYRHQAHRLLSTATSEALSGADSWTSLVREPQDIRNVAIIAHVDVGKTTLVDRLLRDCSVSITGDRVMDSIDLERERGITIMSKVTSITHQNTLINVCDSPGHSDFGGEVERVLSMVDGAVLLVDATEGPMAQTKFVLAKALGLGLRPIVVLNKIDRDSARPDEVESEIFDLFASLDASEEQLDFTTLYASAKNGWASFDKNDKTKGMVPLLDTVVKLVPAPKVTTDPPFKFLVTMLSRDTFMGRIATGRVASGSASVGDALRVVSREGVDRQPAKITKVMSKRGVTETDLPSASAGDIVSIAGVNDMTVGDTFYTGENAIQPLHAPAIDPPTVSVYITVNDSPLAGKSGKVLTTQALSSWLYGEAENNVSISINSGKGESIEVKGRGELQLGILIETMRRQGTELAVSPPRVLTKTNEDGEVLEPIEELQVEVDDEHSGLVIEKLSARGGNLIDARPTIGNRTRIRFTCPSRGLLGYRPTFITDTKGTGLMSSAFAEWGMVSNMNAVTSGRKGVIVSMVPGLTSGFALSSLEARGILFVGAREPVYEGMVVGEHSREIDVDVNPVRAKQLTNMRTHSKDEGIRLSPPRRFTLESAISYVANDELVEVTPDSIRLRKRILNKGLRDVEARKSRTDKRNKKMNK